MNEIFRDTNWFVIGIITLVIVLPALLTLIYRCYLHHLHHQRRILNDELILRLAREGQQLTPELVETIRKEEDDTAEGNEQPKDALSQSYQRLCTGGALVLGGLVVLLRNRAFGLLMVVFGLFLAARGLALYLIHRQDNGNKKNEA